MKMASYIRVNINKAHNVKYQHKECSFNTSSEYNNIAKSTLVRNNEIMREFGKDISNIAIKLSSVNGTIKDQIVKNRKTSDIIHKIKNNRRLIKRDPFVNKVRDKLNQSKKYSTLNSTKTSSVPPNMLTHTNIHTIPISTTPTCIATQMQLQSCQEYINDIYAYLKSISNINLPLHNYMALMQTDINERMRSILLDWLVEVHLKFKLLPETLFITVNIIDRYLSKRQLDRKFLQLLGITAMFIACKYEEIYSPEMKDFIYMTDNSYTHKQMLQMESDVLKEIEFNLTNPSPLRFVEILKEYLKLNEVNMMMCQYIVELSVLNYRMVKYDPSLIATCAVYLEKKVNKEEIVLWDEKYESYIWEISGFLKNGNDVRGCLREMCLMLDEVEVGKYPAVKKKYSLLKYMEVANRKIGCKGGMFEFVVEGETDLYTTPNKKKEVTYK